MWDTLDLGTRAPKALLLRIRHVLALDASGIRALLDLRRRCERMGMVLLLEGLHAQPLLALQRAKQLESFGRDNLVETLDEALQRAKVLLAIQNTGPKTQTSRYNASS